jgi:DNA adenine methylase
MGGGALFFALRPENAYLSDTNEDLMNCYIQIRDNPEGIITLLSSLENTKEAYYAIRKSVPQDAIGRAVRFLYLMKLSFNGVHRVNAQGHFNVPYGHTRKNTVVCDPDHIRLTSAILSSAQLSNKDFEKTVSDAQRGDFIFFDPPYTVAHSNNGFVEYNARIFSWEDQVRLAAIAQDLAKRGCKVLVSNADHASIHALYGYFQSESITRASTIAASDKHRRQITECLFYN